LARNANKVIMCVNGVIFILVKVCNINDLNANKWE